jgi:gas vesicle protein
MKTNNVLGIVAGVAAGALLGVLLAPDKGSKTRKKIKNKTVKAKESLKEEFDNFLDSVSKKYESVVGSGEEVLEKAKKEVKETVNSKI